jgi:hypothetical protein
MDKYDIEGLISATLEQKPSDFSHIFNDLIIDRLSSAVENKKIEIAKSMFNGLEDSSEE